MSNNRESLSRLRQSMSASQSSVEVPFLEHDSEADFIVPSIASLASHLPSGAKVVFLGSARSALYNRLKHSVPSVEAVAASSLTKENSIFSNGKTDLLIVSLSSADLSLSSKLERDDKHIAAIQSVVEEATNGNFVSLFTAESVALPAIETEFKDSKTHVRVALAQQQGQEDNASDETTEPNVPDWAAYFPSWFWEGLVTFLFFVGTALVIIYALMYLQTPTVFLVEKKKND